MSFEKAVIVKNKTRLEQLIERFNTKDQARFYIEHSVGGSFQQYVDEHDTFYKSLDRISAICAKELKMHIIERNYLPNYIFPERAMIITIGQDGLVANTAKYSKKIPILGVNPDPSRYDGILLPFHLGNFNQVLHKMLNNKYENIKVTMAEAQLNDGQSLLAFNDLFIGPSSHTSARYSIEIGGEKENQSSSGIIVSTGAGSTGWLSSLVNMNKGMNKFMGSTYSNKHFAFKWNSMKLMYVVREPFRSVATTSNVVMGEISSKKKLKLISQMPQNGIIFSDGIETDYMEFNSGTIATIGIAEQYANLVV